MKSTKRFALVFKNVEKNKTDGIGELGANKSIRASMRTVKQTCTYELGVARMCRQSVGRIHRV